MITFVHRHNPNRPHDYAPPMAIIGMDYPQISTDPHGYTVPIASSKPRQLPITVTDNRTDWVLDLDGRPVVQALDAGADLPVRLAVL